METTGVKNLPGLERHSIRLSHPDAPVQRDIVGAHHPFVAGDQSGRESQRSSQTISCRAIDGLRSTAHFDCQDGVAIVRDSVELEY